MEVLIDLLKKLSDVVLPSWCQRQPLTVTHAGGIVNLATFALQLIKTMLTSLLSDGDYQLRDTRVVSALLAVHTVLCSAPYSSVISSAAPEVRAENNGVSHVRPALLGEWPPMPSTLVFF